MLDEIIKLLESEGAEFQKLTARRNETIHPEGKTSDCIYLVNKGIVRTIYHGDGNEISAEFFEEHQAVILIESFWRQVPSKLEIRAVERSELTLIPKGFPERMVGSKDFWNFIHQYMLDYALRTESFLVSSAGERYSQLLAERPGIIERVPAKYIAGYLGINPVSLSRIKSKAAKLKREF